MSEKKEKKQEVGKQLAITDQHRDIWHDYNDMGIESLDELGRKYGIDRMVVHDALKMMKRMLRERLADDVVNISAVASERFLKSMQEATEAWEESKKNRTEKTTRKEWQPCPDCKEEGKDKDGNKCKRCDGVGQLLAVVVTEKVVGSPGDAQFLRARNEAIKEYCRVNGLYPEGKPRGRPPEDERPNQIFIDARSMSPEQLIRWKELRDQVQGLVPSSDQKTLGYNGVEEEKGEE